MKKFNNKETYLAYRSEWKAEYEQLSQQIRDFKWLQKEYCRAFNASVITHGHPWNGVFNQGQCQRFYADLNLNLEKNKRYQTLVSQYKTTCFCTQGLKKRATAMLNELKLAKQESQRQYLEAKANSGKLVTA